MDDMNTPILDLLEIVHEKAPDNVAAYPVAITWEDEEERWWIAIDVHRVGQQDVSIDVRHPELDVALKRAHTEVRKLKRHQQEADRVGRIFEVAAR